MTRVPFEQMPFDVLPEHPRRPHGFGDTEAIDVQLSSKVLGAMRVHVRKHGDGPPVLLIHGLMTSSYSWRYVFEPLGEHYTCYALDLPANGRSGRPMEPRYSPVALARWLIEVQHALGIHGCRVIGNSMGGYLAMTMAMQDSTCMRCLVNLHSPGVPEARLWALKLALAIPGVQGILRRVIMRKPLRWAHRHVHYYDETYKSLEEAREYGDLLGEPDGAQGLIKYLAETMDVVPMRRFQDSLRQREAFPVPLLLMYAEEDPMVPPRFGNVFAARLPDAKLVWLSGASHFAHVDATERFLPPVLEFLA